MGDEEAAKPPAEAPAAVEKKGSVPEEPVAKPADETAGANSNGSNDDQDEELTKMKDRLREIEERAKLSEAQGAGAGAPGDAGDDADERSVYVGNVDYTATLEEVAAHFQDCGTVNRVTIPVHKHNGHPKGFAYIEFAEKDGMKNACHLDDSFFKERKLKVVAKRQNIPGMSTTDRGRGRGRGGWRGGRGRGYGGHRGGGGGYRGRWQPY